MTGAEMGILMLTCPLGEDVQPLEYHQFHFLRQQLASAQPTEDRDLGEADLRAMGLSRDFSAQIIRLLDRQRQLEFYLSAAARRGITPLTRLDGVFPRKLEEKLRTACPPALFCKGNPDLLSLPAIAAVGSRRIDEPNQRFAWHVGELAAKEGYAVVSGGAMGADFAAQDACLQNGGKVIVFTPEPLESFRYKENVVYLSEEGWEMEFTARRALNRNRLIHAMGEKSFVAQCSYGKGGSWRGAEENLRQGYSPLFVYDDGRSGAKGLMERGAIGVREIASIRNMKNDQQSFF